MALRSGPVGRVPKPGSEGDRPRSYGVHTPWQVTGLGGEDALKGCHCGQEIATKHSMTFLEGYKGSSDLDVGRENS